MVDGKTTDAFWPDGARLAVGVAAVGFAILALTLGLALFNSALLIGAIVLVIATGGEALWLFFCPGKLLILLVVPALVMVKASLTLLFTRFPELQGRELTETESPALFALSGIDPSRLVESWVTTAG